MILVFSIVLAASLPLWGAQTISLAWDANAEPDLGGYIRYYCDVNDHWTNAIDVGNQTTRTVSELIESKTYRFSVTAYSKSGLESGPSNEILRTITQTNHPPVATSKIVDPDVNPLLFPLIAKVELDDRGRARFHVHAVSLLKVSISIQVSSDLLDWTTVAIGRLGQSVEYTSSEINGLPYRFYRTLLEDSQEPLLQNISLCGRASNNQQPCVLPVNWTPPDD
jgi:hypothetical protein